MQDVEIFLAHAITLERDAARRYEELAAAMGTEGNAELRRFFTEMASYSRKHLAEAVARGGFREVPELAPGDFQWPDGVSPEVADWVGVDASLDARGALKLALDSECRCHAWYAAVAATTPDAELKALAQEFAAEEGEHMAALEKRAPRGARHGRRPSVQLHQAAPAACARRAWAKRSSSAGRKARAGFHRSGFCH